MAAARSPREKASRAAASPAARPRRPAARSSSTMNCSDRAKQTLGNRAAWLLHEGIEPGGPGPPAQPADGHGLVAPGQVDHHGRHGGELHLVAVDDTERDAG